jgi:peptide/nickel transport system ATP-binding protein/oligopeptide transport system ATP-binding protein
MQVDRLVVAFPAPNRRAGEAKVLRAVDDVSFSVAAGEVLGLVGESGSGKTTLGKTMLRLYTPAGGRIRYGDADITRASEGTLRPLRRHLQMIFQDPLSSFNPRVVIGQALALPLRLHRLAPPAEIRAVVDRLLERVGLGPAFRERYPHELSGGQLQRVAIARALALEPRLIVADEPVSKLDVSVRAQILNLFADIQAATGVSLVFITHDLRVARYLSHRIGVMFFGRLVEIAPTKALFSAPQHPYTRQLLGTLATSGSAGAPAEPAPPADASGCRYRSRCPLATDVCGGVPPLRDVGEGHAVACHHAPAVDGSKIEGGARLSVEVP